MPNLTAPLSRGLASGLARALTGEEDLLTSVQDIVATAIAGGAALLDPSVLSSLWADSARTTPASIDGPVGAMDDLSGNGKHALQATSAKRPTLRQSAQGLYYLETNGTSHAMQIAGIDMTSIDKLFVCAAVNLVGDANNQNIMEMSAVADTNAGSFYLRASRVADGDFNCMLRGDLTNATRRVVRSGIPITAVLSCQYDMAGAAREQEILPRFNGAVPTIAELDNPAAGGGNFGNYALNLFSRNQTSLYFSGHFYGAALIGRSTVLTASEIQTIEQWAAARSGVTLA